MAETESSSVDSEPRFKQFWNIASGIVTLCFPAVIGAGGYVFAKVEDHDKNIAVMKVEYQTRDAATIQDSELRKSIEALNKSINDLRVELVKATNH